MLKLQKLSGLLTLQNLITLVFACILPFIPYSLKAQQCVPGERHLLRGSSQNMRSYVPPSSAFQYRKAQRSGSTPTSFLINYTGFSADAQIAFQLAADIWASQIVSDVPIRVEADFSSLATGVLGSVTINQLFRDFDGAPQGSTFYPSALANALTGCDLDIDAHDISISFNSSANWYFGTDGLTPAGQYDFVTVVLHELTHGLGFSGTADVSGGLGSTGVQTASPADPCIYDHFIENGTSTALSSYTNPSTALATQLTSEDLYIGSTEAVLANGSAPVKVYAPATFSSQDSYSHWDETTFPAGNPHSLMTHVIGMAEAIHDPGDITRGLFQDMGWELATQAVARFSTRSVWSYDLGPLSFFDQSIAATSWAWDFDNDGVADATTQNPTYTFPSAGTYPVTLIINGNPSLNFSENIEVFARPALPFFADFESGGAGLYAYHLAGCEGGWEYGSAISKSNFNGAMAVISGANSWMTSLSGTHGNGTRYALELPSIDLSSPTHDYTLEFDYRAACGSDAGFNIEYSIDGGNTWSIMGAVGSPSGSNWYTDHAIAGLEGEPGFSQTTTHIYHPSYLLNFLFGNSDVRIRFKFGASTSSSELDGVQIDNVSIDGTLLDAGNRPKPQESDEQVNSQPSFTVFPNPASGQIKITISGDMESPSIFRLHNLSGQLAKQVSMENLSSGKQLISIADISPGLYLYEIRGEGAYVNGKLLVR